MFIYGHFLHTAVAHPNQAVAQRRNAGVVRDDDDRCAVIVAQAGQQIQHLFARLAIQRAGWLVAEQQRRVFAQRAGNGYTLLLAAGELGWCGRR